jgi:hypothetical protein
MKAADAQQCSVEYINRGGAALALKTTTLIIIKGRNFQGTAFCHTA